MQQARGTFSGNLIKLVVGTGLAQVVGLAVTPLLTRIYPPEAFGTLALFLALTGIPGVVACGRYEMALLLPEHNREARQLFAVCLLLPVLMAAVMAALVCLWGTEIQAVLNTGALASIFWVMPVYVLLAGWYLAFSFWHTRLKRFGIISLARFTNAAVTSGLKLGSGTGFGATSGALVGSTLVGQALATVQMGALCLVRTGVEARPQWSWRDLKKILIRYRRFPLVDAWGALLNCASWQLPVLVLAIFFSEALVGWYALTWRTLQLPMAMVGSALSQVFFQRAAELRQHPQELARVTAMLFQRLCRLCVAPTLALALFGAELFALVFGSDFESAGEYAEILSVWMFFWFVSSPLSNIFTVLERQDLALRVHVFVFSSRLGALLLGGFQQSIELTLWLFSSSGVLVYGGLAIWNLALAGVRWRHGARILVKELARALPVSLLLLGLKFSPMANSYQALICLGLLGVYLICIAGTDEAIARRMPWLFRWRSSAIRRVDQPPIK